MAVLFHNTAAPGPALTEQIKTLPGVLEATFTPVDNAYYAGTLLEMRMDSRCVLSHRLNEGVPGPALESYTIRCYMPDPNDGAPVGGRVRPRPGNGGRDRRKGAAGFGEAGDGGPHNPRPRAPGRTDLFRLTCERSLPP